MHIKSILTPARTVCNVRAGSKKRILELLAQLLQDQDLSPDDADAYEHLIQRERLGSTGIGDGVAIPHCRLPNADQTIGIFMKLDQPVDFDAIDGKPVDLVFALIVPQEHNDEHLQVLASIAELMQNPQQRKLMRQSETNDDLYQLAISDPA
jgi:PTS system nitrogen regulatory IIA component